MNCAVFWSGGKDSLLALDRAERRGLRVTHLANIYEGNTGRVRFHGVHRGCIQAQADALGLSLFQRHTHPDGFEPALAAILEDLRSAGVAAVIFGNIHLADIREWYEQRTRQAGLEHIEPLWGDAPASLIREFVGRGHRARIVGVNLACGRREWLDRELDANLIGELEAAAPADVCGERGEYHSFAFAGPRFRRPLSLDVLGRLEIEGHLILDFTVAGRSAVAAFANKLREQIERLEHLLSLTPPGRLEWRPASPAPAFSLGDLLGHLLDCLAGFCAALHAANRDALPHFDKLRDLKIRPCGPAQARERLRIYAAHIVEGLSLVDDRDLARRIPTVFVAEGEPLLTLLLGNLEHLINHKHQLFWYLKLLGVSVRTPDLYRLRG